MQKKLILTVVSLFFSCILYSQTNFSFDYDANGNRIKREVIVIPSKMAYSQMPNDSIVDDKATINIIERDDIKIYPNPTKGDLNIELNTTSDIQKIQINIISIKGQLLYNTDVVQRAYNLDLSSFAQGAYILIMQVNDKKYEWKIIKE
ncbi:MAG: hypothetical protein H6Q16_238 [Bacteroidetes bacterium]|nr:hypothetical protein [Bacteroidota bacterium]